MKTMKEQSQTHRFAIYKHTKKLNVPHSLSIYLVAKLLNFGACLIGEGGSRHFRVRDDSSTASYCISIRNGPVYNNHGIDTTPFSRVDASLATLMLITDLPYHEDPPRGYGSHRKWSREYHFQLSTSLSPSNPLESLQL